MWKDYEDEVDWDNWEYNENDYGSWSSLKKEEEIIRKDANWNKLEEWDTVVAIKDIKVKWASDIKRGDKFTKIRFNDNPEQFESGKMVLRWEFFKKI